MSTDKKIAKKASLKGPATYHGRRVWKKLVRDDDPARIAAVPGTKVRFRRMRKKEHIEKMLVKVSEERDELLAAWKEKGGAARRKKIIDELADMVELTHTLADKMGVRWKDVKNARALKLHKRGGFRDGMFLEWTDQPEPNK